MEEPHLLTVSIKMPKLLMADATRHKASIFKLDLLRAFPQTRMRIRFFINSPHTYCEVSPKFKDYCGKSVFLVKAMY
jgi:hypothetical protein